MPSCPVRDRLLPGDSFVTIARKHEYQPVTAFFLVYKYIDVLTDCRSPLPEGQRSKSLPKRSIHQR